MNQGKQKETDEEAIMLDNIESISSEFDEDNRFRMLAKLKKISKYVEHAEIERRVRKPRW